MAKSKKTVKKTNKKETKQTNKNDLVFKIVVSVVVLGIIAIIFNIVYGGKRIVCTRTITNDKANIQTAYTFKFSKNELTKIKANAILDYSKDDQTTQEQFDEIVNKINNKEKYENIHINKYNKKADITYEVKISAANLGENLSFDAVLDQVSNDSDLGNCVVK